MDQRDSASCVVSWLLERFQRPATSARFVRSYPVGERSLLRSSPVSTAASPAHNGPCVQLFALNALSPPGQALWDAILRWRWSVARSRSGLAHLLCLPLRFRPDSDREGAGWLLSGSYSHGSDRPPERHGEPLLKLLMHRHWHDLDSPRQSQGSLASTRLRFPLVDLVTDQWDGYSPNPQGSSRTDSHAARKNRQCPDTRLTLLHHQAPP